MIKPFKLLPESRRDDPGELGRLGSGGQALVDSDAVCEGAGAQAVRLGDKRCGGLRAARHGRGAMNTAEAL